jgi:hypothetical protein
MLPTGVGRTSYVGRCGVFVLQCRAAHSRPAAARSDRAARTAQRGVGQPPAQAARRAKHGKSAERRFRGEFPHRVLVVRSVSGVFSRVTDAARTSDYSPRLRESLERKSISGVQRRRLNHRHAVASPTSRHPASSIVKSCKPEQTPQRAIGIHPFDRSSRGATARRGRSGGWHLRPPR